MLPWTPEPAQGRRRRHAHARTRHRRPDRRLPADPAQVLSRRARRLARRGQVGSRPPSPKWSVGARRKHIAAVRPIHPRSTKSDHHVRRGAFAARPWKRKLFLRPRPAPRVHFDLPGFVMAASSGVNQVERRTPCTYATNRFSSATGAASCSKTDYDAKSRVVAYPPLSWLNCTIHNRRPALSAGYYRTAGRSDSIWTRH